MPTAILQHPRFRPLLRLIGLQEMLVRFQCCIIWGEGKVSHHALSQRTVIV